MGLLSSSKPSSSSSALGTVGIAVFGGTQISLTLLEKMMDGVPVPFVKGAAGAAVEVIKIARVIKTNREECDELLKRGSSLLVVILSSFSGKPESSIPDYLKRAVERLTNDFHEVLTTLRTIDARAGKKSIGGFSRALLYHYDNAEKLKGCSAKLDWAMQEFQVTSKVGSCLKDVERHEELRTEQAEIEKGLRERHTEILKDLAAVKDAHKNQTITDVVSSLPSTVMPANPCIFGRNEYVENAVKLLLSADSSRLAILGPGGIGKTSVSLKIVHDTRIINRFGKNRHWVACEQVSSIPLLIELLAKSLKLPTSTPNDRFRDVVEALESSDIPHLFLFDNFETPWDIEGQQSYLGDILSRIASITSTSFVLTMRGNQQPYSDSIEWTSPLLPSLTQLELGPAEEAFLKISPDSAGDPELQTLLRELDCMPLAITLMAKLARSEKISELLSQWKSERTKLLGQPGGDRRTSIEVSIKLSLESRSLKGNTDAVNLLGVIAMLPGGAFISRLPDICPSIPRRNIALRELLDAALIYHDQDKSYVRILSPIRAYTLLHHPIGESLLQDLQKSYFRLAEIGNSAIGKPDFLDNVAELVREETNMDAILLDGLQNRSGEKSAVITASLNYSEYLLWTQPRTNIIKAAEQVTRDGGMKQHAACLRSLGDILRRQSNYEAAYTALEEAKAEFISLDDRLGAANCLRSLGNILRTQTKYEAACTALEEAKAELTSLGDLQGAANCLQLLGDILRLQTRYEAACTVLEEAKAVYNSLGDRQGAANCLQILGDILRVQSKYEAACTALEEAKAEYYTLGDRLGAANCLQSLGTILRIQSKYEAACAALEEAKAEYTSLEDRPGAANCLKSLGDILKVQTKYEAASTALAEAKAVFTSLGDRLGAANCLKSLGDILRMQAQDEAARTTLEEAKEEYNSLGDRLGVANCLQLLGDILWALDECQSACTALEEATSEYTILGDQLGVANSLWLLGLISQYQSRFPDALNQLEEAKALYTAIGLSIQVNNCIRKLEQVRSALTSIAA